MQQAVVREFDKAPRLEHSRSPLPQGAGPACSQCRRQLAHRAVRCRAGRRFRSAHGRRGVAHVPGIRGYCGLDFATRNTATEGDRAEQWPMADDPVSSIVVNNIRVELIERGAGRPLLFLHPGIGIEPTAPVLDRLAARARVLAPVHPGFGGSEQPKRFDTVDDLAYFYLDLLEQLELRDTIVVGVSFGGWIAAEIAIKSTERISHLVLANAVGIKVGDREQRDIVDIYAIPSKSSWSLPTSIRSWARMTTRRCRMPRFWPRPATGKPPRATPGRPTCMIPSCAAACTAFGFRRWCCGGPATACCPSPTGARIARPLPGRGSVDRACRTLSASRAARDIRRSHLRLCRGDLEMRVYQFTEQPYPDAWSDHEGSLRVNLPNRKCEPIDRGRSVPPLLRRMAARRRARLRHHAQ